MKKILPDISLIFSKAKRFWFFTFSILLLACNPAKPLLKDAQLLENGGLRNEAFEKYNFIYVNYSNSEARIGMKRVAQKVLEDKTSSAQSLCMSEQYEAALVAYDEAIAYRNANVSLELSSSRNLEEARKECISGFVNALYLIAENDVKNDDFDRAKTNINRIFSLDRNNQKAQYLELMCDIIPNYNSGKLAIEKKLWREAYDYLNQVCKLDAGFRDALSLRDMALLNGNYAIVYKITDNKGVKDDFEEALAAVVKGKILDLNNPFIELLERDNLDEIIKEQQQTLAPEFEDATGAESGKLKRARFVLAGEIINQDYQLSSEMQSKCDCALVGIYSDKVNCYINSSTVQFNATYKYNLLDAETGKLYKSDVLSFSDVDAGKNYTYEVMKKGGLTSLILKRNYEVDLSHLKIPVADPMTSEQEFSVKMNNHFATLVAKAINEFKP